jgi:hypothetical protein
MDMDWEVYRKLLYPTVREWQIIHNHHTCDRLAAAGDSLERERAIEHNAFFPTREAAEAFAGAVEAEGFRLQKIDEPTGEVPRYGVRFYRTDRPWYHDIDAVTLSLIDASEAHGGAYDGWETSLVKG